MRLGDLDLDPTVNDEATPINYAITRIIRHAEYDGSKFINDIALLKLNSTVAFTGNLFLHFHFCGYYYLYFTNLEIVFISIRIKKIYIYNLIIITT